MSMVDHKDVAYESLRLASHLKSTSSGWYGLGSERDLSIQFHVVDYYT